MPTKQPMHIMTSSDNNLALYILPQLAAIGVNLQQYDVHFYLFHSRIEAAHVETLRAYAETFEHITFREIKIIDTSPYEKISISGGGFPPEAYFSLCCHDYLPDEIERVLYIDAGDVIINGDVGEYYFADFEGNSLIAHLFGYTADNDEPNADALSNINDVKQLLEIYGKVSNGTADLADFQIKMRPYRREDMSDPEKRIRMLKPGIFNSGCYVINVEQFRADGRTMGDYLYLYEMLCAIYPGTKTIYYGDQAFMSVAFVGEIKYFGISEGLGQFYMPYNFCLWYLHEREDLPYTPIVLHYGGAYVAKPWKARYSMEAVKKYNFKADPQDIYAHCYLNAQYVELLEFWWKYCAMTPVYEEMNRTARIAAAALEKNYLPLCKWYNELVDDYRKNVGKNPPQILQRVRSAIKSV